MVLKHLRPSWLLLLLVFCLDYAPAIPLPEEKVLAQTLNSMEVEIYRDPWASYSRLQEIEQEIPVAANELWVLFYLRKAQALHFLYKSEEFNNAINSGLDRITPQTPDKLRILLRIFSGIAKQRRGNYHEAIKLQSEAVEQAKSKELINIYVFGLVELAYTKTLHELNESALNDLQEAFSLAHRQQDEFLIAMVDEVYGVVYAYMEEFEKSIEHNRKALFAYEKLGYKGYESEAVNGIAITYRNWKKWDEAIEYFNRYRKITENNGMKQNVFTANYGLGTTYAEKGDCTRALEAISTALSVDGPDDYKAELYKKKAICLAKAGQSDEALDSVGHARDIFDSIPELQETVWGIDLIKTEAIVMSYRGNYDMAFELLLKYHEKYIDRYHHNYTERLMKMRVDMEEARKDLEIELLKEHANVNELILERQERENQLQRYTTYLWIAITCIVIAFVFLQRHHTRQFMELSTKDELTGLYNRRYIFNVLDEIIQNLPVDKGQLSIMIMDIDDFKEINDEYGHPAGDKVLKNIAEIGLRVLRNEDTLARIGGEEFLCVLPRTSLEQCRLVAERLLRSVREHGIEIKNRQVIKVTASIGIAGFNQNSHDTKTLYKNADQALYESKSNGKDRVTIYS